MKFTPAAVATSVEYSAAAGEDVFMGTTAASTPTPALTWTAPDAATAGVSIGGTIVNSSAAASGPWSLNVPSGWIVSPSSGSSVGPGATVNVSISPAAGTQDLILTCPGATISGNPQSIVVSGAAPTALAITGSATGVDGSPTTITGTLDAPATAPVTVTPTPATGATFSTPAVIGIGQTSTTWTVTRATSGTAAINASTSPSLTVTGGYTYTSSPSAWTFSDAATVARGRNTTTTLRTGLAGTETVYASPDLLPGESLVVSGGTLSIVGDSTVPTVDGSAAGSAKDAISARDIAIAVIDSPAAATVVNVTRGITYAPGASYTGRTGSEAVNRWNAVMNEANPGDIIEISPGYLHQVNGDLANSWSGGALTGGSGTMLSIWKPCTIRNMSGQARWRLWNGTDYLSGSRWGIGIFSPSEIGARGDFVIEGFEIDNFGVDGFGVYMKNDTSDGSTFNYMHASLTLRNFKVGRPAGYRSLSGIKGLAQAMTLEDGHVYDCGSASGLNHNMYLGAAQTFTMRGVRTERTRGWTGTPYAGGTCDLDGHLLKLQSKNATIEGCAFVCGQTSGPSELLQMYAGGNLTVRGCLFVDTPYPNNANGAITMLRELQSGGPPNYDWYAGADGNSILFERNVYVGHYPRPIIWFFDPAVVPNETMYAAGDTSVVAVRRLSATTVRDNIAIVTSTAAPYMLGGFPGASNAMWINNDPNAGGTWAARGNTARTYNKGAWAFTDRELLLYADALGAPAAGQGSQSVPQFLWPHGYRNVTRSTQGLG